MKCKWHQVSFCQTTFKKENMFNNEKSVVDQRNILHNTPKLNKIEKG